ncbi:CPBP family intramembrane glutamic endopeptidase [Parasediminibacterium paludis]|uniref:CPBP family intramembrane glutamic endopeptidase n=1 Tax=Parasediminibacterium paludis TaxID=908966 RepID=A0ABV8PZ37_9BACT
MEVNDAQLPQEGQTPITTFEDYIPKPQPTAKQPISYFGQLAILLGLSGGGLVVGGIISIIIFIAMKGGGLSSLTESEMLKPENANINKVIQLVSTLFLFFTPAFFFALIVNGKPLSYLGFNKKVSLKQIALVVLIAGTGLFLSGALGELNQLIPISKSARHYFQVLEDKYVDEMLSMVQIKTATDYIIGLLIIALAPAILEELFFRGALQQLLTNWTKKPWLAIAVTSVVFSAVHFSYFGFLPRAMLGAVLGLLFYYSKNIWTNILAHFFNNAIAISQIYFLSFSGKVDKKVLQDLDKSQLGGWQIALVGIASAVAMIVWLGYFKKESDKILAKIQLETA